MFYPCSILLSEVKIRAVGSLKCHTIQLNNFITLRYWCDTKMAAKKRQVCFRLDESLVKEMEQIRDQTGVPVSTQVEMRLKGFSITRSVEKQGSASGILRWYKNLAKDEEYADSVDEAVERMRDLRLH